MALSLTNFTGLVSNMTAAAQGRCAQLLDYTVGSVVRSLTEGCAAMALWLQLLIVQVLARSRLTTSVGTDVDTFCAQFNFTRLPGTFATGHVVLSRNVFTQAATVPVGATVITLDGSVSFEIVADPTNPLWNAGITNQAGVVIGGFVIPGGTQTGTFLAQSVLQSTTANVAANTIGLMGTAIPFIDTPSNPVGFFGGTNPETDAAMQTRFQQFITSRSLGTLGAVEAAIQGVANNIRYAIAQNISTVGAYQPGNMVITVDDGSGNPPSSMLTAVSAAVDAVRAATVTFTVQPPAITTVNVAMTVTMSPGFDHSTAVAPIQIAVANYLNALAVGAPMAIAVIPYLVFTTEPPGAVANVTSVTLNGGTADITVPPNGVCKAGTITVN